MKIVVHHDTEEFVAQWLADAIKAQFPALVTEVEIVREPQPQPLDIAGVLGVADTSGLATGIGDIFVQITSAFTGLGESFQKAFAGLDMDEIVKAAEALEKAGRAIESADGNGPKAIEASPQPAQVHAGISGTLVPHSEVYSRTSEGRKYLAAATFNPVLPHANQPIRLSIAGD